MLKTLGSFAVLLILTQSCKKKNDEKSKTELLTQKTWIVANYEIRTGGSSSYYSDYQLWDACQKDDRFTFKTNNSAEVDIQTKCDPSQTNETLSWAFAENETKITLDGATFTIEQLDENNFVINASYSGGNYKTTYRHP